MSRYRIRERIVSAGVEDDDIGAGVRHRVLEAGKVDGAQSKGRFALASGVNRQKIVLTVQLNAMSSIEEKSEFGAPHLFRELSDDVRHLCTRGVGPQRNVISHLAEFGRNVRRIIRRIR
jgi:hypothetical protein